MIFLIDLNHLPPHVHVGERSLIDASLEFYNVSVLLVKLLMPIQKKETMQTGSATEKDVSILRISVISLDIPFYFKRLLFISRACFEISINKSRTQILKVAGLQLQNSSFCQGQFYIIFSPGTQYNPYHSAQNI